MFWKKFWQRKRAEPEGTRRSELAQMPPGQSTVKASLLSLESRLMFDAAATATATEVNQEQVAQKQAESALSNDDSSGSESQASVESQELLQAIAGYLQDETPIEVAFVDPTVPDHQTLIAGMGPSVQIVMLDGGQDGMEQIAASLAGRTGIDAIHIISHGVEGQLSLGTGTLTQASMTGQYADELAIIKQALSEQADILVYGCDFAQGQIGQDSATLLSQLTGADVAASIDATGQVSLGGDWDLEVQTGVIETSIVIDLQTQADWVGLLAAPVLDASKSPTLSSVTEGNGVPSGAVGTLVSQLADFASPAGQVDNVTDPDSGALLGIAVTAADTTNGTWWYSTNNGASWSVLGAVTNSNAQLLAADSGTRLYFQATDNASMSAAITFRAWDQTIGTNGGTADTSANGGITAFSTATDTASLLVTNVDPTLTVSGNAAVIAGGVYTLNLSAYDPGADTINSWTINWGDGTITTVVGNPSSTTHIYANEGFTYNISVSVTDEDGTHFQNDLLVPVWSATDQVYRYDGSLKTFLGTFASGQDDHVEVVTGPDGSLYVSALVTGDIVKYASDGTLIGTFVASGTGGLSGPAGLAFGPDGNLYVTDYNTGNVLRFDGATGGFMNVFVNGAANGISSPLGITFGPDGQLYVANRGTDSVLRFDSVTGARDLTFTFTNAPPWLEDIAFGPDGALYAADLSQGVLRYSAVNGAFLGTFVAIGSGGLSSPAGVTFGPDGNLYVADQGGGGAVRRYDGATGAFIDNYVTGLVNPAYLNFAPSEQVVVASNQLIVDTTADNNDSGIVDGNSTQTISWLLSHKGADGFISLREAIIAANNTVGTDGITFNIVDPLVGGAHTIDVLSALPMITDDVILDATTDADFAGTPIVVLDGSGAGYSYGLEISATSTVRGLVINQFQRSGIWLTTNGNDSLIVGNYIGTDVTGMIDLGNNEHGIESSATGVTIGGLTAADRNVISGNNSAGVVFNLSGNSNTMLGNYIGVDAAGTGALANGSNGVYISSANNVIGGSAAGAGNVISGNNGAGILVDSASGTVIQGNYIGLDATGSAAVGQGNLSNGIWLNNATNTVIGGTTAGARNVVSGNTYAPLADDGLWISGGSNNTVQGNYFGSDATGTVAIGNYYGGISIANSNSNLIGGTSTGSGNLFMGNGSAGVNIDSSSTGNSVLGNRFIGNSGLGIDLDANGVTANDAGDTDTGANNLQNFPVLFTAFSIGGNTTITGTLNSTPSTTFRIEFFSNTLGMEDASGYGEGQIYLGFVTVTTDGSGNATINTTLTGITVPVGDRVTATATVDLGAGTYGATSEFAMNVIATSSSNQAPSIANLSGDSLSYSEGAGAVVIEQGGNALVADVDSTNFDTGTLAVSIPSGGDSAEDVLSIRNQGTSAGQIGVSGYGIAYGGTLIGSFTGGANGSPLVITFNANATPTAVTALVNNVTYQDTDTSAPTTGARTVRFVLTDGDGGTSANYDTTVTVSGVNDAPVVTLSALPLNYTENGAAGMDVLLTVSDVDSANLTGATIRFTANYVGAEDQFSFTNMLGISGTWDSGTGTLTLTGTASVADYQTALRTITYFNSSDNPNTATRTFEVVVTDSVTSSTPTTRDITISAVNDAPVVTLPPSVNATASFAYTFSSGTANEISVADTDAGMMDVTISVSNGSFTLFQTTGLTFSVGDGDHDAIMRFTGSVIDVNAALNGSFYRNGAGHGLTETITITADDLGQMGVGGPQSDSRAITVNIADTAPVSTDGFLQGNYLEIGLGADGALGSDGGAPVSFQSAGGILGAVVDNERDGWATYDGDYVTPGSPVEAWGVHVGGATYTNANNSMPELTGTLGNAQSGATGQSIEWLGSQSGLDIRQIYTVGANNLYLDIEVQLTNISGAALTDIYYYRNIDPDNNYDQGSPDSYYTTNTIVSQGNTGGVSMVTSTQVDGAYFSIVAFGANSRVTYGGFNNTDPTAIYNGTGGLSQSGTLYDDVGVSVAYRFATIGVGETMTVQLRYYFGSDGVAPAVDLDADNSAGVSGNNFAAAFTENGGPVAIADVDAVVFNPVGMTLDGMTATITNVLDGTAELLQVDTTGTNITANYDSNTGVLTLSGSDTVGNYQAVLRTLQYDNTSDNPSVTSRVVSITALSGTAVSNVAMATVAMTVVNDAPVITPVAPDVTFVENGAVQVIDATGTITDVDSTNFDTGIMTVSVTQNGSVDDRVMVGNFGMGPGQVGTSGSTVTYGGVAIGTFTGGSSGSDPLVITFNSSATQVAVQEVYRSIQFNNVSENPSTATRQITFSLTDGDGGTATPQTKLVYVQAVNDAPVNTVPGAQSVGEDTPLSISGLSVNDVDGNLSTVQLAVGNGTLSVTLSGTASISAGANGSNTLTLSGTQADINAALATLIYQGVLNFNGSDVLTITSTDTNSGTDVDIVAITVSTVNDPTVVTGGTSGSGNEDSTISNTLTATDVEGLTDGSVFTVSANATNGTASINPATGLWSYTPNADFNGSDSFTVTITDDAGNTATQVITVTVTPVTDITNDTLTTNEDTAISANVLTGTNGATADSFEGTPVLTSVTQGANGSVTYLADGTATYTPNANFTGTDSFTYTITSGGVTETATVTVNVQAVNDAPVLVTNTGSVVAEGGTDTIASSELAVTDVDQSAAQLTYTIGSGPASGRLELTTAPAVSATSFTQADIAAGRLVYLHNGSETTSDSFTFTVSDGAGGAIGLTTVTLTITPVNDTPTITSDGGASTASISVVENVSTVTIVTGADVDLPAQALTYSISGGADQALFTINAATGALHFITPPDFEVATDANGDNVYVVQVQVTDSQGASTTQTVQVTVTDVAEGVPPTPPVLLAPLPPSGGPTPGQGTPPPPSAPTPGDSGLGPAPISPGPTAPPVDVRPSAQSPFTLVPPPDRPVVKIPDEVKHTLPGAEPDKPIFFVNDEQGRPLFTVLPVKPTPTLEPEPPQRKPVVSDLLLTKLDEMTVSLERAVNVSREHHELVARITAMTGTTLSVGFVAWALRSGVILTSLLAAMPAWSHFDPLPVVKLSREERKRRRDEVTRAGEQETKEFTGLNRVLGEKPPLKRTA